MSLNTIKKIGPVLELFTPERPEWRMTEIARALGMPKSSAHSLVTTLAEIGLLAVGPQGRYRLGWNLLSLAERMRASLNFREHALPTMQELAGTLHETVFLAALDRHEVVYVERAEGNHPMIRLAGARIGTRVPAHAPAVGKAILAQRDPAEVRALLTRAGMRAFTRNTITDIDAFEEALVAVRARGVAFDLEEIVPDVSCAAVPLTDRYGTVVAGLSVSMPSYRFPADRTALVERLKAAGATISAKIAGADASASGPALGDAFAPV